MSININHSSGKISSDAQDLTLDAVGEDFNVNASNNRIVNLHDPIDLQDAVTKKYLNDRLELLEAGTIVNIQDILDKLTPQSPPTIDTATISMLSGISCRITDFTQVDNTGTGLNALAGSIVNNVLRNNDFTLSAVSQVGPGHTGTLEIIKNGSVTASVEFTESVNNGSYTDTDTLIVSNNVDYGTITGDATGFFQVYDVVATGTNTVPSGWNNIKLSHTASEIKETNTVNWYSDQSNPGNPVVQNITVTPSTTQTGIIYSSTIPHYTNQQYFDVSFEVGKLSGDFYPATDTFAVTSLANTLSPFGATPDITYQSAGMPVPLPQNYLLSTVTPLTISVPVKNGTGISTENTGFTITVDNSYATTVANVLPAEKVLYMFNDLNIDSIIDETHIIVTNVGYGNADNARRIETTDTDTPLQTSYTDFNGETSTLNNWDATVVGGRLTHDTTDYSTGYLPAGPDLSSGREGSQYIVFGFNRTTVSKFAIEWSGKVSGCWIKLPGTQIDSTSTLNGWIDATVPYEGIGIPGANTAAGGNGSNGCGLAGTVTTGSNVVRQTVNVTFGTESSSNATNNIILVRFKLNSGDSISVLKFKTAT